MRDPYEILGVAKTVSASELQSAYRKLAKKLHPDLNPGDKAAEEKFKEVAGAYDLLGDPDKRRRFDAGEIDAAGNERQQQQYYRDYAGDFGGNAENHAYQDFGGFSDFMGGDDGFAEMLRRAQRQQSRQRSNRRGEDRHFRLPVDFRDTINGATQRLTLPEGGTLDVKIPAGLVDGQKIRLKGKGEPGYGTGGPGDALIEIEVIADPRFQYSGDDITVEVPVSLTEAILGGKIRVPTPTGEVAVTVPKGSNTGTTLRLRGKGVPKRGGGAGDELVKLKVTLPKTDPDLEAFVSNWSGKDYNPRGENT